MPSESTGETAHPPPIHQQTTDPQAETIAFLLSAGLFGAKPPESRMTTHISQIFLYADRAVKLKRAIHLPYLDFSTPQLRLAACERELALNRRTAPHLYIAVHRVTREADGRLILDGTGELVDALVEMRRFDNGALLSDRADHGALPHTLLTKLARTIAAFHRNAEIVEAGSSGSAITRIIHILDLNRAAFDAALNVSTLIPCDAIQQLDETFRNVLTRLSPLIEARAKAGKIRHCHGDLHLKNICIFEGEPTLFDCLEFDDDMARIDILYDLAFLLMDLWHRHLGAAANWIFNRYLDEMDEEDGLGALPFFMALRAAIRAHVAATVGMGDEARSYFALAESLLQPLSPSLVAIGGLSGTGKSTLAAALAPAIGAAPGARILASDRLRKRRFGVSAETRLPVTAYAPEISAEVYAQIATGAEDILRRGHGVLADAVFDRPADRSRIGQAAEQAGCPFLGFWLEASLERQIERVEARRDDPSDADAAIVHAQRARTHTPVEWTILEADGDAAGLARRALQLYRETCSEK